MSAIQELRSQTEDARNLLMTIRDILGDDDQAVADAIEGETQLVEAIQSAMCRVIEVETLCEGIATMKKNLSQRQERLTAQAETLRTAIGVAMDAAGLKRVETPVGTVTLKATAPKAIVHNEADVPAAFWKPQDPKLDRAAVLKALKNGQAVPGAELSNGGMTIQIKDK